jgi:glycogen synthase
MITRAAAGRQPRPRSATVRIHRVRDVFICHASEDKADVARPLVEAFERAGISCWYDEDEIGWGDSITAAVNDGLHQSRFVLVILSAAFMRRQKQWPKRELFATLNAEATSGGKLLLPLLVGSPDEQRSWHAELSLISDKNHLSWDGDPAPVVRALRRVLAGGRPGRGTVTRVCHISSEYPPHVFGGLGVHVEELTKALGAHLDVEVVLPSAGHPGYARRHPRVQPVPLAMVEASYADPLSWLRFADFASQRIIRRAKKNRPDVIHCHDWVTALAGVRSRWALGIPLVMHLHLPNRNTLCASVENLGLVCADQVTVNSEAMYEELMGRGLPLRQPPEIIENGVDLDTFRPADGWPADDNYLLFVGRLVEQKGVEYLIRAYLYVRTKYPDLRLKVVGSGDLREALAGLATNLLLADGVDFLGWQTGSELVGLYQRAAAVVVPSIYEPFGMTALEALACRRPVVASREGGLPDIVRHREHGFLAEPKDELDLAQWLMALLSDPARRNSMGTAGRAYVQEHYRWSDIAGRYLALYTGLRERPVDRMVPDRAEEFIEQVARLAEKPLPDRDGGGLLSHLFDWDGQE